MNGLLFPIIMLTVTLLGGGVFLLILKNGGKKPVSGESAAQDSRQPCKTAMEFINIKDIKGRYLYTKDGMILTFLRLHAISIDLLSRSEKNSLIKQLTAELSDIQYPFKFMAVSRPVDISPLINELTGMLKDAGEKRKELLRHEILQMSSYALSGEIVERQFYISIWDRYEEGMEKDIYKRAALLSEKFSVNGIGCDIIGEKEIVRLINLVHNPAYVHLEDTETMASIPLLKEAE